MITRCPKCHTSFRITQAQLQTAKGSVRCGSCLHIFKALDHLVQGKTQASAPKPAAKKETTPRKFSNDNETVVRPLPTKPKFEYQRPKTPDVSAKDIAAALKSSLTSPAATKPSPTNPPSSQRPRELEEIDTNTAGFAIPNDILDEDERRPIGPDEGQQNMLVFDQRAIDSDDFSISGSDEEELLISDDMDVDGEEKKINVGAYGDDLSESFLDLDNWTPKERSLFDRKQKPPKEEEDNDDKHSPDESWAIELMEDDSGEGDELPVTYSGVHASLDELDLEMEEPDYEPPSQEYSRATTGSFNTLEDSDIEDALGEPLGEHIEPKFDSTKPVTEKEFYPEFDYDEDQEDEYSDRNYSTDNYADDDYQNSYDDGEYYSQEERSALLRRIRPAPVEFSRFAGRRDWRRTAIWGGSIAAGVLALIIQVAWLQFDTLSRQQPYRSLYSMVGVSVPPMSAPNLIRASNLVVRSHPNADNALMVDAILLNTASFAQPFPDLVLNFSDVQGKTLADRRFKPEEYLGGELAGVKQMPIGQPVHLSLEIVDPGPNAVSYSAYIPN